jgi:hypothetical protein
MDCGIKNYLLRESTSIEAASPLALEEEGMTAFLLLRTDGGETRRKRQKWCTQK